MEENKNLEGQVQQNQEPDNKPEEKEPTVEELMAQLAQERANSAKLQNDYNKASSEAANYRKQLKAKQTAEEQEEEAKKEAEEEHKKYVKGLEDTIRMTNATNRYLAIGMSAEMAKDTANAELENDMEKVTENGDWWETTVPKTINGVYVVELTATDEAGNIAYTAKYILTIDITALRVKLQRYPYSAKVRVGRYFARLK